MPEFRKNIDKTILKLDVIEEMLDDAEVYEDEDGNKIQTMYLGSILSLTPSDKVYYPFACSNVMGCPHCKGTGAVRNKNGKPREVKRITKKKGELLRTHKARYGYPMYWPTNTRNKLNKLHKQETQWKQWLNCQECSGSGSLEARLDEDWWNRLESELETIEAWHHGSEGNGCDILISRCAADRE